MTTQSDPEQNSAGQQPPEGTPGASNEPATFDADYVKNLRAENARYRTEAKANADAAKKLADLEDAQKTETQRLADAKTAAETDAAQARAEALRWRIAAKHGISDEQADLFLTGTDEETLTKQAAALASLSASDGTKTGPAPRPDLSQGARNGAAPAADPAGAFASFIGGQLNR